MIDLANEKVDTYQVHTSICFFRIADFHAVPFDDLLDANRNFRGDLLHLSRGDVLNIPESRGPRSMYTIRAGDSLFKIALLIGIPPRELREHNPFLHGTSDLGRMDQFVGTSLFFSPAYPVYKIEINLSSGATSTSLPPEWQGDFWVRFKFLKEDKNTDKKLIRRIIYQHDQQVCEVLLSSSKVSVHRYQKLNAYKFDREHPGCFRPADAADSAHRVSVSVTPVAVDL